MPSGLCDPLEHCTRIPKAHLSEAHLPPGSRRQHEGTAGFQTQSAFGDPLSRGDTDCPYYPNLIVFSKLNTSMVKWKVIMHPLELYFKK